MKKQLAEANCLKFFQKVKSVDAGNRPIVLNPQVKQVGSTI